MWITKVVLLSLLVFLYAHQDPKCCNSKYFEIIDDPNLNSILSRVHKEFMQTRAVPAFNTLNVALMIPTSGNKYLRATVGGSNLMYPASSVKMHFMLAAMYWCRERNRPVNCLDIHVRQMVGVSSNFDTGVIVDITSGAPNIDNVTKPTDPVYTAWLKKRQYTERLLESKGLLSNQRVLHKTYPANSAWPLVGAEKVAREELGMNMMQPCCSAVALLEVLKGKIVPEPIQESVDYAKSVLLHTQWSGTHFGPTLPPGTIVYNKAGWAYDNLVDIAYIILPNKKEFILSAFSNAYQRSTDTGQLAIFSDMLVEELGLDAGITKIKVLADDSSKLEIVGPWKQHTNTGAIDRIGKTYYSIPGSNPATAKISVNVNFEQDGLYEVIFYNPSHPNAVSAASITVHHQYGSETITVNQKLFTRWIKIGDFNFKKGYQRNVIEISNKGSPSEEVVMNAIKITRHPYCFGAPGGVC